MPPITDINSFQGILLASITVVGMKQKYDTDILKLIPSPLKSQPDLL
jgi:hypothetical protein